MNTNSVILIVLVLAFLFDSFYKYLQKESPSAAEQLKSVDLLARWAVSLFDTVDLTNEEKQTKATQAVLEQAKKSKIKLTETVAKGAVEKAVTDRTYDNKMYTEFSSDELPTVGFNADSDKEVSHETPKDVTHETTAEQPNDLMEVVNVD